MACKNCVGNMSLDELENQMFAHLWTKTDDGWTVKCEDGTLVTFASVSEAKEFILSGEHRDNG